MNHLGPRVPPRDAEEPTWWMDNVGAWLAVGAVFWLACAVAIRSLGFT